MGSKPHLRSITWPISSRPGDCRDVASAPARVVSTASAAHQGATVDFDDLQLAKTFGPMKAYGPFGALQHSLHARTRPPSTRHGRDRQLPASRLRPE